MASFKESFASARKAGKKEFKWNGKSYNTKLAADTPKKGPVPTPRPQAKSGTRASEQTSKNKGTSSRTSDQISKNTDRPSQGPKLSNAGASYPRPAKQTGVASPSSKIGQAAARRENTPKSPERKPTVREAMAIQTKPTNKSYEERKKKK